MKKQEFFEKWTEKELMEYHILFMKNNGIDFTIYCWEEDGIWHIEEYQERGVTRKVFEGNEEECFEQLDSTADSEKIKYDFLKTMM